MTHYNYHCNSCQQDFDSNFVESEMIYLCPDCGAMDQNQPLRGVLTIQYDYNYIKKNNTRQSFMQLPAGQPWLYPGLWPLEFDKNPDLLQKLALPSNLVYPIILSGNDYLVLDDTRNPTYSYKDRASVLVVLKAIQSGITDISVASTGNAGSSLAGICARTGLKSHIWIPDKSPSPSRLFRHRQERLLWLPVWGSPDR